MIITIVLVAAVSMATTASAAGTTCSRDFRKVGCFKRNGKLFNQLLITDLDPTHKKWGNDIDWNDLQASLHSLACRCREKAYGTYKYFALGFYGECWGAQNTEALEEKLLNPDEYASTYCINGDHGKCDRKSKEECAGKEDSEYVYEIVEGGQWTKTDAHCWAFISGGCVNWHNIKKYSDKSVEECKALCSQNSECLAIEYGVAHGGIDTRYRPRDCQLQNSAAYPGCDGNRHNLDLYIRKDCKEGNIGSTAWPPRVTTKCTQSTKQKAMYGGMTFSPPLSNKEMIKMNVQVKWNDLQFAPYNTLKRGGVYVSYTINQKDGPGGYFGVQLRARDGSFLFSIWDADRWTHTPKQPKPSSKLVWPLNMNRCKRNCQNCGLAHLRPWKEKGLTTGTQCSLSLAGMKKGDHFDILLQRSERQLTINTLNYGGMPKAHADFGERDREITGGMWIVNARNIKTNEVMEVGKILFEGDGRGMHRLETFDEMIGCNGCNMIYHSDTRYGPFIDDGDGTIRKPIQITGKTRAMDSICKQYYISGSKANTSLTFESGPLASKPLEYMDNKYHNVW